MTNRFPCLEWADKLALKPADLAPDERAALQEHLATCPGCAATRADYQALSARLRALPPPALPPLGPLADAIDATPDIQPQPDHASSQRQPQTDQTPPPGRLPPLWRASWPRRLSAVAAVLLVAVLVGSLSLLLTSRQQNQPGSPTPTFTLRPGWAVIAEYSGVGNQTFTGLNLSIPRLWGDTYICGGGGKVQIELESQGQPFYGFINNTCNAAPAAIIAPQSIAFDNTPKPRAESISVTADPQTTWRLQLAQAVTQPAFKLSAGWIEGPAFSGSTSVEYQLQGTELRAPDHQPLASKLWGVVFVCTGIGTGYIQFTPDVGNLPMPACDEQPHLIEAHYPAPVTLQAAGGVVVRDNIVWSIQIIGCAHIQQCSA